MKEYTNFGVDSIDDTTYYEAKYYGLILDENLAWIEIYKAKKQDSSVFVLIGLERDQYVLKGEIEKNHEIDDTLIFQMLQREEIPLHERISLIQKKMSPSLGLRKK